MGTILKENELNQLVRGTVLFQKGEKISFIGMIVKGSIRIQNGAVKRIAKKGTIIAAADVFADEYLGDYITEEDTIFYAFPAFDSGSLEQFLIDNSDYKGIVVHSMEKEVVEYLGERERILNRAGEFYHFLKRHYELAIRDGMDKEEVPRKFFEVVPEVAFELACREPKVSYYQECAKVPLSVHNEFYHDSDVMAFYQASEIAYVIQEIIKSCQTIIKYIEEVFYMYWNANGNNLFDKEVRFAKEMKKNGQFKMEQFIRINDTKDKTFMLNEIIEQMTGKQLPLDRQYLEETLKAVLNTPMASSQEVEEEPVRSAEDQLELLHNSLLQILDFAKIKKEEQQEIITAMNAFVHAKDRLSTQDDVRKLKKQIALYYFKVYKICLFEWFENANVPLAVKLFLNYGYMDERLLDDEQIVFLCEQVDQSYPNLPCDIYTMPEWLKAIYEGRKDTSRDSFERDYRDALREQRRTGRITDREEREYLKDNRRKVIFEIENMFTSNNKIVNGKLSTYVPVLYKDEIYGDIERLFLSKQQLADTILELEEKDFTIFNREVLYTNPQLKIEKEYVIKHVYPDVILAPVYGTTSSMWQEITGKKRDTPGRFIFPSIVESEVYKLVTKAFGRFHWEYCRCEQGTSWNNIQYKSLTSEYMDYIQYYRKNHDLSEERREKIKVQIQRARNNSREIFLNDYELWIYYESKAAMKLNKVSRAILATYCPFNKDIREFLKTNTAFSEAMMRQIRNFGEKAKEWDMRIKRRENNNLEVPEEFYRTYEYYADH